MANTKDIDLPDMLVSVEVTAGNAEPQLGGRLLPSWGSAFPAFTFIGGGRVGMIAHACGPSNLWRIRLALAPYVPSLNGY